MSSLQDHRLNESSSLVCDKNDDKLGWSNNDERAGKGNPQIFGFDLGTGKTVATIEMDGLPADADPEALAQDPDGHLWLADIGNGAHGVVGDRTTYGLYKLKKANLGRKNHGVVDHTKYVVKFKDGKKYNTESFIIHPKTGAMYVITKMNEGKVFKVPTNLKTSGVNYMQQVAKGLPKNVSDATFTRNGDYVIVRVADYSKVVIYQYSDWKEVGRLTIPGQAKSEGVSVSKNGKVVWSTSEAKADGFSGSLQHEDLPPKYYTTGTTTPPTTPTTPGNPQVDPLDDGFDPGPDNWIPPSEGWQRRVPVGDDYNKAFRYSYNRPWGLKPGDKWTGFTTRSTGAWESLLTGFVQGLLSVMFEEAGAQWSIRKDNGRQPVLYLREIPTENDPSILVVDAGAPGVGIQGTRDFTQSANVIYGEGQDEAGTTFSGAQVHVDNNGPFTSYEPFAYNPAVWPFNGLDSSGQGNPKRNPNITAREAQIKFPQGMDFNEARNLARAQYHRFSDPGFTGTVTLKTDPRLQDGRPFPRILIKAGRTMRIRGMFGREEGILVHITETSLEPDDMTVTLTIDSKYRDALTVSEVRARTRDALTPLRSLQVGKYTNTVQDLLYPWSYTLGSGVLPETANPLFQQGVGPNDIFPYENVTTQFPPKTHGQYYVKIPKNGPRTDTKGSWTPVGVPIRMGAAGTIRLLQIAAYDVLGHVLPVKFHLSLYTNNSVAVVDMPILISGGPGVAPRDFKYRYLKPPNNAIPDLPGTATENYKVSQRYPFYETAWEQVDELGQTFADGDLNRYPQNAGLVVGWGNFFEPAGYSPGRFSRGAPASGKLVDESSWSWNLTSQLNQQVASDNIGNQDRGHLYAMIYCDDLPSQDVYFMGRMFRVEPGSQ